ncbi:MAG: GDP-L-fucose synthase [Bacteroidetes bacterium]|nr:GDP-L-fucose synthase [Bacteroidota bacterium]
MDFWNSKRVTVTGGKGFLGSYILEKLKQRGCQHIAIADLPEFNLTSLPDIRRLYQEQQPDIVIHLAAIVGGIGANRDNPGKFFYENAIMGIQLVHEAYLHKIEKFIALGTICAYPKFTPVPFKEENLWNGYPEETNAPYGLAKKMMLVQSQAYREQYGFNSIFLLPVNLYGPRDNFDPKSSHVIPALIRKFYLGKCLMEDKWEVIRKDLNKRLIDNVNGNSSESAILKTLSKHGISKPITKPKSSIQIWGTGKPSREFIYVEDAAEGILLAAEKYNKSDPVNIGAGFEITIKNLVNLIVNLTGFKGKVIWDTSKPDGQPRRMLDTSKAEKEFGFKAKTSFKEGLMKTIEWYKSIN